MAARQQQSRDTEWQHVAADEWQHVAADEWQHVEVEDPEPRKVDG
jgi:hypothetical protein